MFIMSIMVLVVYYGAKMITFSTLNQAMRVYGIKDQKVQVVYGEHSAMAPYEGLTDISLEIFSEKNGRWKMPYGNSDQILEVAWQIRSQWDCRFLFTGMRMNREDI